jgi:hypothetical protein
MSVSAMNVTSLVKSFKSYLERTLDIDFYYYQCDTFIYGFEGSHVKVDKDTYFYRFVLDLEKNKCSLYLVKRFDGVQTIIENVSGIEAIASYYNHYNHFINDKKNEGKTPIPFTR